MLDGMIFQCYAVDQETVDLQKDKLLNLIKDAKNVTLENTIFDIRRSQKALYMARGMYEVMVAYQTIKDTEAIGEELQRAENKIENILSERYRMRTPVWRR